MMPDYSMDIPRFQLELPVDCQDAVQDAISNGELAIGPHIDQLERRLVQYLRSSDVVTTCNGFAALHVAVELVAGRSDQEVLIPACSTCYAMPNAVQASGNWPVLYDIDLESFSVDLSSLKSKVTPNTAAVVLVPHFGLPVDIQAVERQTGLPVIVDAAQAFFSIEDVLSDSTALATLSLYPTKGLVGIDGGAIVCHDRDQAERARDLRYYDHQTSISDYPRYNYKMPNINAALALCYLDHMEAIVERRWSIQRLFNDAIEPFDGLLAWRPERSTPLLQKYVMAFQSADSAQTFLDEMRRHGIGVSRELNLLEDRPQAFPNGAFARDRLVSVPSYDALSDDEVDRICRTMVGVLGDIADAS